MKVKGFELVTDSKVTRAVQGSVGREGKLYGGLPEGYTDEQLLAAYDKLGGLIRKNGHTVKTGCFFDFKEGKAFEKPKVILVFRDLEGNVVEIEDGKDVPLEVKAAEMVTAKKKKDAKKVGKK